MIRSPASVDDSATRASSRSRLRARWAPRLLPANACTSSTITVCTCRSTSRAAEVSIKNSDSGVVIKMSGGWLTSLRRSPAEVSPERTPTVTDGGDWPSRRAVWVMPGEWSAQVALDVDRQRLERRDVEHPAALLGRRLRVPDQRVEGGEEGRQGLAGSGRRDDERVLPGRDGLPGAGLGGCGLGEHLAEPGGGRRAERGERIGRCGRGLNEAPSHPAWRHRQCCRAARARSLARKGADTPSGTARRCVCAFSRPGSADLVPASRRRDHLLRLDERLVGSTVGVRARASRRVRR